MSCFVVSDRHVSEVVREILGPDAPRRDLTKAGRMILRENWRAYRHRYGEDVDGFKGKNPWARYVYDDPPTVESRSQLARWAASLAYQLAELADWETTEAYRLLKPLADEDDPDASGLSWIPVP